MSLQRQYSRSVYLAPGRPEIPRQRSNSLPIGLAMMNKEEAGILFSAAEKAHSRRKRTVGFNGPALDQSPSEDSDISSLQTMSTVKTPPLDYIVASDTKPDWPHEADRRMDDECGLLPHIPQLDASSSNQTSRSIRSSHPVLNTLPISPRRQVASRPLKGYSDELFSFTQNLLNCAVPHLQTSIPQPVPSTQIDEKTCLSDDADGYRPKLQSHFSEWSVSTHEPGAGMLPDSWRTSFVPTPSELDFAMMSPGSFFGEVQATPRLAYSNRRSGGSESTGYASSGTYDPPSGLPAPTPESRASKTGPMDDFSYFSDFSQFCDRNDRPDRLVINLSPIEAISTSRDPPPALRQRAETAIRDPVSLESVIVGSCAATGTPGSGVISRASSASSSDGLQIQTAQVAVRVPNWLVGAIS